MARFVINKYGVLEINRAEFRKTGMVVSQLPLSNEFTAEAPCENGMWVDANTANGEVKKISVDTKLFGIVYTAEKDYTGYRGGLRNFCQVEGDYPRVGLMHEGDVFTTNVFSYDSFSGDTAAEQIKEIEALVSAGLYVEAVVGDGAPKLTASKPAAGLYGQVVKTYTLPDGTPGIKYVMMHA